MFGSSVSRFVLVFLICSPVLGTHRCIFRWKASSLKSAPNESCDFSICGWEVKMPVGPVEMSGAVDVVA